MTCREVADFLMDYLTGELPEDERVRFREHLDRCRHCVAYLSTYETAVRLGRDVCGCGDDLPADVPEDLVRAILHARNPNRAGAS